MRYVLGLVIISVGFLITWKAEWMMDNFGRVAWAEEHLGTEGGTRLMYKLIGISAIVLSFMYMSGLIQAILTKIFGASINTVNQ
ncbi:MAG: hypothetical protein WC544_02670 [Patescibacteria group bacterium]